METCSRGDSAAARVRSRRRLLAAALVSLALHALLATQGLEPGKRKAEVRQQPRYITARLMTSGPRPPPALISPVKATAPDPPPALRRTVIRDASPGRTESERPRGAPLGEAPDLTYYAARELDVYPVLSAALDLHSQDAGLGATRVLLLVSIDETGVVTEVSVIESERDRRLEADAQRALRLARFSPAIRNGRAVRSRVLVHVGHGADRPDR